MGLSPFILYVLAGILFYNPTFLLSILKIISANMSSVILSLFKDFYTIADYFDALIWSGLNMGCGVKGGLETTVRFQESICPGWPSVP